MSRAAFAFRNRRLISPSPPLSSRPADSVYFGEVSLSGAARPVAHAAQRLREAEKLGFSAATVPSASADLPKSGIAVRAVETLSDLVAHVAAGSAGLSDED